MDIIKGGLLSMIILASSPQKIEYVAPDDIITPVVEVKTDPLFEKIGWCESRHTLTAKNPNSSAKGEFQFLDGTWKHYGQKFWGDKWVEKDVLSKDNRELAWFVYTHYGTSDWEADPKSYECWKSEIPNATHRNIY